MKDEKAYQAAWYLKNRERLSLAAKIKYAKNPEPIKSAANKRYQEKRDLIRLKNKAYAQANPDKMRFWKNIWKEKNPHFITADAAFRRARRRNATPQWVNREALLAIYQKAQDLTVITNQIYHVDHIYPLVHSKFCGLHVPWNLRVITAKENLLKNNRIPESMLRPNMEVYSN